MTKTKERIELKKIMVVISAGLLAYDMYDRIKRTIKNNNEKNAILKAEAEIEHLERELAAAKRNQYDIRERRRTFKR